MTAKNPTHLIGKEFTMTREFAAPRELVWRACTESQHLAQWWGPKGFTAPVCEWDAKPGNKIYVIMRSPDGEDFPMGGEFREIVAPEKLVTVTGALDAQGKPLFQFLHTLTLVERGGKTVLTMHSRIISVSPGADQYIGGFEMGMKMTLDRLVEYLAAKTDTSDREIVISREFAAPRALAWEAMTNPKHVVNWWGPRGFTSVITEHDFRVGGHWEHVMTGPDGVKYPNFSTFKEIVPQERIVFQNGGKREGGPGVTFIATWTFEELGPRKTRVTMRLVLPSAEMRNMVVKEFGAIEGGKQNLEKMGEFLAEQQCPAFTIEREFNAPRELVWKAWTEREHLMQWFGPKGCKIPVANLDFRVGGCFHYCMATPDGKEMWGKWIFRQIVPPEKIVLANSFSDKDGNLQRPPFPGDWSLQMLTITTFTEQNGKTTISLRWFPIEASEAEIKNFDQMRGSFKQGWTGTFDQLTEYLAKAQA